MRAATVYSADQRLSAWQTTTEKVVELAASRALERVRLLELGSNAPLGLEAVQALASSPYLAKLETLVLRKCNIGDEAFAALAASTALPALRELDLFHNRLTARAIRALVDGPLLVRLEALDLLANEIGDEGVRVLAEAPAACRLRALGLGWNRLTSDAASAIAASPHLSVLQLLAFGDERVLATPPEPKTELDLRYESVPVEGYIMSPGMSASEVPPRNRIGDDGVAALAASTTLQHLEVLALTSNGVSAAGLTTLCASALWPRLEWLSLRDNKMAGDDAAEVLAAAMPRSRLADLDLDSSGVALHGLAVRARLPQVNARVTSLRLADPAFAASPEALADAIGRFEQLTSLTICENAIDERVARLLAPALARLPRLQTLSLSRTPAFGDAAARVLAPALTMLTLLRKLDLPDTAISAAGAAALIAGLAPPARGVSADFSRTPLGDLSPLVATPQLRQLSRLSLSEAHLDGRAAQALAGSEFVDGLESLDLTGNQIDEAGVRALAASPHFPRLKSIGLCNNRFGWCYFPWTDWDGSRVGGGDEELSDAAKALLELFRPRIEPF